MRALGRPGLLLQAVPFRAVPPDDVVADYIGGGVIVADVEITADVNGTGIGNRNYLDRARQPIDN